MNVQKIITSEFSSSISRAIREISVSMKKPEDQVQIVFEIDSKGNNIWKLCSGFEFIRMMELKEILYINPMYAMFKSRIPEEVKKFIIKLSEVHNVPGYCVSVFAVRSKAGINAIRLMLFIKGVYVKELMADNIN